MSTINVSDSSWLELVEYIPLSPAFKGTLGENITGFLIIETEDGRRYAHPVPSYIVGLMSAAKSRGRAYGKLVRGKYPGVRMDEGGEDDRR